MAKFIYEAKKSPADIIKGSLMADNRMSAIHKIDKLGYCLIDIHEEQQDSGTLLPINISFFNSISLKDVTDFSRQLSDLLESGLIIIKALEVLASQTENKRLKIVIIDIQDFCVAGNPFSSALARHPKVFSDLFVNMVRSGETGGALESVLRRLSDFSEKQLDIQTKVRTALAYPILMSVIGTASIIILLTFVMPKMMVMFDDLGQALPWPTQIILGLSYVLAHYGLVVVLAVIALGVSLMKIYATPQGQWTIDGLKLRLPLAGKLIKKVEIARFLRTLATLLNNGLPMLEALKVVSATIKNVVIRQDVSKAFTAVREGASLAKGFDGSRIFPLSVINMIRIGEESGHLERSLLKIAEASERESDEMIKIVMSLLEPVLILVLGVIVGFIVIAMLLPIFEINFLMK